MPPACRPPCLQTEMQLDDYSEIDVTEDTPLKCAAVLIPLVQESGDWHVLYTRRTQRVESHKGQVSFPGGACDEGETTPEETALREAQEEIGIDRSGVRVLGRLSSMITITTFRVTPVVGVLRWPAVFRLNENEVERIFTVPLGLAGGRRKPMGVLLLPVGIAASSCSTHLTASWFGGRPQG